MVMDRNLDDAGGTVSATGAAAGQDMNPAEFRHFGRRIVDWVAGFLEHPETWRVLPDVRPGELLDRLPASPPAEPEPFEQVLDDFERLIPSATTHWNHPGFMAYFATSGSGPGILAELLIAALNAQAMLWRTGPAATEMEQAMTAWLLELMGLPATWEGTINDTASTSTLYALAAARESLSELEITDLGMTGRELPALRLYCSAEAHSSVDKAAMTLGIGRSGVRRIRTDSEMRMDAAALADAVLEDIAAGIRPVAVVATTGTTSTTSIDPVPAIADVCEANGIWLHVDAAYGGTAAILPEMRYVLEGCDRADSLVVNPHKWLFVPMDCSVLYTRRPVDLRNAFAVTPEYLKTPEGDTVRNLSDAGLALGRRFRALKLWFVFRYFGEAGIRAALRRHMRLASEFGSWVDADPAFERMAPSPFSVVVFRWKGTGDQDEVALEQANARILERVNASGEVFLSHTKIGGRYGIRLAVGNIRTEERHVARAWELIREAAAGVG